MGDSGLSRLPRWAKLVAMVVLPLVVVGGLAGWFVYALDQLYPQSVWKYFRPSAPTSGGTVVYRNLDGQLYVADAADPAQAHRILDSSTPSGSREVVRDALVLPDRKQLVYYASEVRPGQPEVDHLKVAKVEGGIVSDIPVGAAAGEPLRPAVFASASGRYLAVTSRDRTRVYYVDLNAGAADGALRPGTVDAAPERMLWNRNGDVHTAHIPGQRPFASSPDGTLRAQVRDGSRRAPECGDARCEAVQELVIAPASVAQASKPPAVVYGVFASFSSEGWGPVPAQPAQRLYGRLVWSPDGKQVLFSTVDGEDTRGYVITADGKTQPRLLLEDGEALDWVP